MESTDVERWLTSYERAWRTNDPADIRALFTEDARYLTAPYREPWSGAEEIVRGWLGRKDEQGEWTFEGRVLAVQDDLAFVQGRTVYHSEGKAYANLWVIRMAPGGRASEFTEWWMEERS